MIRITSLITNKYIKWVNKFQGLNEKGVVFMDRPKSPCYGCEERNVEICVKCEKQKRYEAQREEYYKSKKKTAQEKCDWVERFPQSFIMKAIKKTKRFK